MIPFDYVKPETVAQLVDGLRISGSEGAVLAGGTDLLVKIRHGMAFPGVLFDISELADSRSIIDEGHQLRIGAAVRMSELGTSAAVQRVIPSLATAVYEMSSRQIRNRATLGGNIVTASPAADAVPPLLAAGASLVLVGQKGRRETSLAEFLTGPGKTTLKEGEILLEVIVPDEGAGCISRFVKVGRRKSSAISVVNLASWMKVGTNHVVNDIRIVLGAVAPTAIRAKRAEEALRGRTPSAKTLAEVARLAGEECHPISDVRGSDRGRRLLVEGCTLRMLQSLLGANGEGVA